MNTFKAGQKVRITPKFAEDHDDSDGSYTAKVGVEGTVQPPSHDESVYVAVQLPGEEFPWLFIPEELETV